MKGQCFNTVVINVPTEKVWKKIKGFHDLSWATGVVTSVDIVGDKKGDQIGAKRVLNKAFHETLLSLDDNEKTFSYSIDDGPGPVSKEKVKNYIGTVKVIPVTENNTTFVSWQSSFESSESSSVSDFCNPIYQALLNTLKKQFS